MCFVAAEIMAYNAPSFISTKDQTGTRHCFLKHLVHSNIHVYPDLNRWVTI